MLSPLWADPETCQPGETPLACELRTQRPVFALISLEVWWKGRTPERYEQYMRLIIEQLIANGTVPILSTKADNVEGDHAINLATARLAYEYDLPLWNWWRAAQALPNRGLDPTRPDGFHISIESWPLRSVTALETLDALWRGLEGALQSAPAAAVEPNLTAMPTAMPTVMPTVVQNTAELQSLTLEVDKASAALKGSALVFDLYAEGGASLGIFSLSVDGTAAVRLAGPGWSLQAVSPDGRFLLANQGGRLVLLERRGADVFSEVELSAAFAAGSQPAAVFAPDGSAILWAGANGGVASLPLDGRPLSVLIFPAAGPVELLPAGEDGAVYALAGSCTAPGDCERGALWRLAADGSAPARLEEVPLGHVLQPHRKAVAGPSGSPGRRRKPVLRCTRPANQFAGCPSTARVSPAWPGTGRGSG